MPSVSLVLEQAVFTSKLFPTYITHTLLSVTSVLLVPLEMFNAIFEQLIACVADCSRLIGLAFSLILMLVLGLLGLRFFCMWLLILIIMLLLLLWILRRYDLLLPLV